MLGSCSTCSTIAGNRSTVFISQLDVKDWHQHINDPTLADAILDPVVHDSHRIEINSRESMRRRTAKLE